MHFWEIKSANKPHMSRQAGTTSRKLAKGWLFAQRFWPCVAIRAALVVFVFSGSLAAQQTSDKHSPTSDETVLWLGGFGSLDNQKLAWYSATLELEDEGSQLTGKLKTDNDRIYPLSMSRDDDQLTLQVKRRTGDRKFVGRIENGVLTATCDDDRTPNKLILRQIRRLEPTELTMLAGIYSDGGNRRIGIRDRGAGLSMTDYATGKVRFLYPLERDRFVAGPAIAMPDPIEFEFQFLRDDDQRIRGVRVKQQDEQSFVARRRPKPREEEFTYASFDGTKIRGTLTRPPSDGPFPTIVWVHGSGKANRGSAGSWPMYFADMGFAVLAVDKRGVGQSEGKYELPGGGRDNFPHMRRRSRDVAAAVQALASESEINSDRIGLVGSSQAGWVIPMSVGKANVAFAMILSGGATPLSVEGRYSRLAREQSSGSDLPSVDELIQELRSYEPDDVGIDSELSQVDYPCLWLYGYRDRSNPSQLCVERIEAIGKQHARDFTVKVFPSGNHGLLDCQYGGRAENQALDQVVPGLFQTIEKWVADKQLLAR